jgi:hypothetical protein
MRSPAALAHTKGYRIAPALLAAALQMTDEA